jgi:hypothetical protein
MPFASVTFEELNQEQHRKLFVVDYHLDNPPSLGNSSSVIFTGDERKIMFPSPPIKMNRFKHCIYKVGGFEVVLVWPLKWPAPKDNAYGWLPKLEFGDPANTPYYNAINPALVDPVQPFKYVTHTGEHITPDAPA